MKTLFFFIFFCFTFNAFAQNKNTVSGFIREKGSRELLIGVNVSVDKTSIGTNTNTFGFYSLSLPKSDSITLVFSYVGYIKQKITIGYRKNIEIDIELESNNQLEEVVVSGLRENSKVSESVQMSKIEVPISQIKKIPTLLGEKDVLKVLQLMPGVQKGSEGQSGLYVRGGGPDQNLIIVDDAIIYNASHLFGFFSTFNGDAIKSVELTKGGFPARFGGRLSSVIEMNMKDGSKQKFSGEGGIGLIASRLVLEGPIKIKGKIKSSYIFSGRRTYQDQFARPFIARRNRSETNKVNGGYYFYDLNGKINYEFGKKDKLYLSGYFGKDKFGINIKSPDSEFDNGINWGNGTGTLRWNHLYSQKLFSNTSLIYSNYVFNIVGKEELKDTTSTTPISFNINYSSAIRDLSIKHDFDYFPNQYHAIKIGFQHIFHRFIPEASVIQGSIANININNKKLINTQETGLYAEDTWMPINRLKINAGLRLSLYQTKGKTYFYPEPRLAVAFKAGDSWALKASYAQMNQYLHLLSNTGLGLPTDLWVPATAKVSPQRANQVAAGFAKDINETKGITFTVEGYYKLMSNIVNYKEGASFLSPGSGASALDPNASWEDKITSGNGNSYGVELLLQKKIGRFSGWTGYTWSKTVFKFEELNFGNEFFPKYDRRHDISIVGIYELNKRITLSGTWVYGTGNALTIPISEYTTQSSQIRRNSSSDEKDAAGWRDISVNEYGNKNSFRAEAYHRLDLGIQFHKVKRRHERTWDISVYNAYNRKNPFFYTVGTEGSGSFFGGNLSKIDQTKSSKILLKRYSLFPIIPSITYNFKF